MTFSRIVSSEQKRVLFEELKGGGGRGPRRPRGIVAPGNSDYSSKARAARVFVCPPQPARAWPQAPSPRLPPPPKSRARVGEGLGIVCGQRAAAGTMGKGGDQGWLPGGDVEMSWTEGEAREGEWLWAKGRKNAVGLRRQGAECRGGGGGRTCKVSIQPPVGESWRGWERGATSCYEGYFGA